MTVRRIALGLVVASLVVVSALGVVAAVLERGGVTDGERAGAAGLRVPLASAVPSASAVPAEWRRVRVGAASYAVPPAWSTRPATERVAYREGGTVLAAGRGYAAVERAGCAVGWAVLADPVPASNAPGVAQAMARAWARGYAGLPEGALPAVRLDGLRARVEVPFGDAGCAAERAELTAFARPVRGEVVVLVVARYLDVPGAPTDAAYAGVIGSLAVR